MIGWCKSCGAALTNGASSCSFCGRIPVPGDPAPSLEDRTRSKKLGTRTPPSVTNSQHQDALPSAACPSCKNAMPVNAVVCVNCGYDLRNGSKIQTDSAHSSKSPEYTQKEDKSSETEKQDRRRQENTVAGKNTHKEHKTGWFKFYIGITLFLVCVLFFHFSLLESVIAFLVGYFIGSAIQKILTHISYNEDQTAPPKNESWESVPAWLVKFRKPVIISTVALGVIIAIWWGVSSHIEAEKAAARVKAEQAQAEAMAKVERKAQELKEKMRVENEAALAKKRAKDEAEWARLRAEKQAAEEEAVKWYRKAAEQGSEESKKNLADGQRIDREEAAEKLAQKNEQVENTQRERRQLATPTPRVVLVSPEPVAGTPIIIKYRVEQLVPGGAIVDAVQVITTTRYPTKNRTVREYSALANFGKGGYKDKVIVEELPAVTKKDTEDIGLIFVPGVRERERWNGSLYRKGTVQVTDEDGSRHNYPQYVPLR